RKNFSAKYRVDYSQLYHNKYFTDYDAKELGNRMEVRYYLSQKVRIIFSYNYTISEQIGDNEDFIKKIDASYESDTYYLSIRLPLHYRDIYFYNNTEFENRYYSSKFVEDTFHIGRNDKFWTHEVNLTLDITKRIRGKFFYEIKRRFTDSYYEYVEDEKNYQTYKIGIGFSTNFK
ncbi:MAG: hypothetical protein SVM86_06810, partial [Candidatus Cloacimonadota bacterium]|nr:hypothetical protein [Candidatus Cloacimonadota bacterium]